VMNAVEIDQRLSKKVKVVSVEKANAMCWKVIRVDVKRM
jgi:hypothetical protein